MQTHCLQTPGIPKAKAAEAAEAAPWGGGGGAWQEIGSVPGEAAITSQL